MTIFILAGGKSFRFGDNKAYQKYLKKTFLDTLYIKLKKFANVYIIKKIKRAPINWKRNIILEKFEEFAPIFGIYTGLKYSRTKFNLFIPVDMPLISLEIIENLIKLRENACYEIEDKLNIFPLLLKKELFLIFEKHIKNLNFTLSKILDNIKIKKIKIDKIKYNKYLRNFNYKKDLFYLY